MFSSDVTFIVITLSSIVTWISPTTTGLIVPVMSRNKYTYDERTGEAQRLTSATFTGKLINNDN